jgi:hypothetical protein
MNRAVLKYIARLLFSTAIILFIIGKIDWTEFGGLVRQADPLLIGTAFFLLIGERIWAVFKWRVLLAGRTAGARTISLWNLFCIYSIGAFWGLFLPSSLSTDVIRGYYLHRELKDSALAAASVVVDRMLGLFSLLFLCIVSVLFFGSTFGPGITRYVLLLSVASLIAAVLTHLESIPDLLEKKFVFFAEKPLGRKLIAMHRSFLLFKRYPLLMARSFLYSLVLQVIRVVTIYVTARAFGIEAELFKFFLVVPVTVIIIMIPVSVGGLGVREGSFVTMFALVGIPVTESFAISATNSVMVTLIALAGGLLYLVYRNDLKREMLSGQVKYG